MSIDITEQAEYARAHVRELERDGADEVVLNVWRAILATLERVAAEERPEGRR